MDTVIKTFGLCKTFSVERYQMTLFKVFRRQVAGTFRLRSIHALENISLDIFRGEKVGLVGDNGSGKTTLLKTIGGLYAPNSGYVTVRGEAMYLAGFGIGLIDDLTVRDNTFFYGAVYGMDRKTVKDKFHDIMEWSGLKDFAGAKLRTLSSGMRERLAFSAMRHIDADIFLLDEALSAGDKHFKKKCEEFFEASRKGDKTFLVATHDLGFVRKFCSKTIWLHKGRLMAFEETKDVLSRYEKFSGT
jgi:ABC-type polysaccharide/polyol phosphate transport system ATPase subunit